MLFQIPGEYIPFHMLISSESPSRTNLTVLSCLHFSSPIIANLSMKVNYPQERRLHSEPVSIKQSYIWSRSGLAGTECLRLSVQSSCFRFYAARRSGYLGQAADNHSELLYQVTCDDCKDNRLAPEKGNGRLSGTKQESKQASRRLLLCGYIVPAGCENSSVRYCSVFSPIEP